MDTEIPQWLLEHSAERKTVSTSSTHFIARTIHHFSEVFENDFFVERYAAKKKFLQCINARVKFCVLLIFVIFSSFSVHLPVLLILAVVPILYAKLSGLKMGDFVRRTWGYIPVVVLIFSIPGASSLFVHGTPLFYLIPPHAFNLPNGVYFTTQGLEMLVRLVLRSGVSLSFGFLLLLTTRWTKITEALASMHVPAIIIAILNMAYRYIFVMSTLAKDMMEARTLRTVGKLTTRENRKFMSHGVAYLFVKSHFLSEEIYDAMVCRGFSGKTVRKEHQPIKGMDILFILDNAFILFVLLIGEFVF
ncbi:MAG TPA: cobalt ECF transporter T component CbiQ [Ruminococcaceae bacterium]|nr:cobalt ECF transporter T component CbiQ [Oscillospiraceae bacterium]